MSLMKLFGDAFKGTRALITQNYTEVNVKTGTQRVLSVRVGGLAAGNKHYIGLITSNKPVIVKGRMVSQNGSTEIQYSAKEKATFSGGTPINIRNPNNRIKDISGITAKYGVTPDDDTWDTYQYLQPYSIFGSGPASGRIGSDVSGLEYVLQANTSHVFTIDNVGSGAADVFWWFTCYIGDPDLPVLE